MVMNAGERGLSWRNLIDMRQFYLAYPKSVKASHKFRFAECGGVEPNFLAPISETASHLLDLPNAEELRRELSQVWQRSGNHE
jgi:hypothetical protein